MKFGKNKKGASSGGEAQETPAAAPVAAKGRKLKPNELLSSVVKESVVSSGLAVMKENAPFLLPNGAPVIVALPVDNIGGLSLKNKGDADKGSIIELIKSDQIATFVTSEMLANQTLGIIPNEETVGRMAEYSQLLGGAEYLFATVRADEDTAVVDFVSATTFADIEGVISGRTSLAALIPDVWVWGGGTIGDDAADDADEVDDEIVDEVESDELSEDEEFGSDEDEDEDQYEAEPESEPVAELEPEVEAYVEESVIEPETFDYEAEVAPEPSATGNEVYDEYVNNNIGVEYSEDDVKDVLVRRYLSSDLDIGFTFEGFDAIFEANQERVVFDTEDQTTTWLGDQVQQIVRSANAELNRVHTDNLSTLRQRYSTLLSKHIEQVILDVDIDREGSYYSDMIKGARTDYEKALSNSDRESAKVRAEIEAEFNAEAVRRGEQARVEAENRYRDRNRPAHLRRLAEVMSDTSVKAEETFAAARQTILEMRVTRADTQVAVGETRILEILQEQWAELAAAEQTLVKRWSNEITDFVDTHRKDDVARAEALSEQLAREDAVAKISEQSAARLAEEDARRVAQVQELEQRLVASRTEAVAQIDQIKRDHEAAIDAERNLVRAAVEQSKAATNNVEELTRTSREQANLVKASYDAQISEVKTTVEQRDAELSRSRKTFITLGILAVLAAGAAGMVGGMGIAAGWFTPDTVHTQVIEK